MVKKNENIHGKIVRVPSRFAVYTLDATMPQEGIADALNYIATERPDYRMELRSFNYVVGKGIVVVVEYNPEVKVL